MDVLNDLVDGDYLIHPRPEYHPQFASRDLVSQFLDAELDPADDPRQADFGFSSTEDYAYWAPRLCGLICLKMILDGLHVADSEDVATLTAQGVALGGYNVKTDQGWYYQGLIKLAGAFGVSGRIFTDTSIEELCAEVVQQHYPVASVHPKVIRGDVEDLPEGTSGGHLVVIIGIRWRDGECEGLFLHNSSGRTRVSQEAVYVTRNHFMKAYARRGFVLWPKSS